MPLEELFQRLVKSKGSAASQGLSTDDVLRAIEKLKILGNGFSIIQLNRGRILVQSVPGELSLDQNQVVKAAQESACISVLELKVKLNWEEERSRKVLYDMVVGGLVWIDTQSGAGNSQVIYWFPSLFRSNLDSGAD